MTSAIFLLLLFLLSSSLLSSFVKVLLLLLLLLRVALYTMSLDLFWSHVLLSYFLFRVFHVGKQTNKISHSRLSSTNQNLHSKIQISKKVLN